MTKKDWMVSEVYSDKYGLCLEFRRGIGKYELSPRQYFHDEAIENSDILRLNSRDIGYRLASQELTRLYGENWNV